VITANSPKWYHSNVYNAESACKECGEVIRHDPWCSEVNSVVRYTPGLEWGIKFQILLAPDPSAINPLQDQAFARLHSRPMAAKPDPLSMCKTIGNRDLSDVLRPVRGSGSKLFRPAKSPFSDSTISVGQAAIAGELLQHGG
jgi:hypothetical protein